MARFVRNIGEHLKTFWEEQPVIFISVVLGAIGPIMLYVSPLSKKAEEERLTFPVTYPWDTVKDWKRKERTD